MRFCAVRSKHQMLKVRLCFEKYQRPQASTLRKGALPQKEKMPLEMGLFPRKLSFVEPKVNPFYFGGRVVVGLIILYGDGYLFSPHGDELCGR